MAFPYIIYIRSCINDSSNVVREEYVHSSGDDELILLPNNLITVTPLLDCQAVFVNLTHYLQEYG